MTRYISNPENLKLMMMMLRDPSRNIQFEAFHVFKVKSFSRTLTSSASSHLILSPSLPSPSLSLSHFPPPSQVFVANPNKTKSTQDILLKNKDKLVEFLSKFHTDRTGALTMCTYYTQLSTCVVTECGRVT